MAVTIRELRLEDVEAVVSAVEKAGVKVDRAHVEHRLSVVACGEDQAQPAGEAVGVVLCTVDGQGGITLEVACPTSPPDIGMIRQLIDRALAKVLATGIRTCRVQFHGELPTESDPLSTGSNWFDRFEQHLAA